jgi:hypothetical protein
VNTHSHRNSSRTRVVLIIRKDFISTSFANLVVINSGVT